MTPIQGLVTLEGLFIPHAGLEMTRSDATPIVSTTPTIEGTPIRTYLGVVIGQAILSAESTNDVLANLRDSSARARVTGYQRELAEARALALDEMTGAAVDLGGDAVVGVDLDYETVGASASMLMVTASGTAVRLFVDGPTSEVERRHGAGAASAASEVC